MDTIGKLPCPQCRKDLVSNDGYLYSDNDGHQVFKCHFCCTNSTWELDVDKVPRVIRREYHRYKERMI